MPPTIRLDQAKGFGLFMLKAMLGGRVVKLSISRNKPVPLIIFE
jgi:hypothetical protein